MIQNATPGAATPGASTGPIAGATRALLACAAVAGPLYLVVGLTAACFVFALRSAGLGERGWAAYSVTTGVVFFAGFFGIAAGSGNGWTILGLWIAVVLAWAWITAMSMRQMRELEA